MLCLPLSLATLLAAAAPGAPGTPGAAPGTRQEPVASDEGAIRAWERLPPEDRQEIAQWFAADARFLDGFQSRLIRWALEDQEVDPGTWPRAARPPVYDPQIHAAAQPIPRKWLAPDDPRARDLQDLVFRGAPQRRIDPAYRYDYASGGLVRLGDPEDPERVFANALAGLPPRLSLAEALAERALDRGELRGSFSAFAHAYTDRAGTAFPGVTLYDAWGSGIEMEMPDVDCLGIVHELLDDWKTWKAPVRKQQSLYKRIGDIYTDVRRHRQLRGALARCWLQAEPALEGGHAAALVNYHALWESLSSDPTALAEALPGPATWKEYLATWARRCSREEPLFRRGEARAAALAADQQRVRAMLLRVMKEFGAFAPPTLPAGPPPTPPPAPDEEPPAPKSPPGPRLIL